MGCSAIVDALQVTSAFPRRVQGADEFLLFVKPAGDVGRPSAKHRCKCVKRPWPTIIIFLETEPLLDLGFGLVARRFPCFSASCSGLEPAHRASNGNQRLTPRLAFPRASVFFLSFFPAVRPRRESNGQQPVAFSFLALWYSKYKAETKGGALNGFSSFT